MLFKSMHQHILVFQDVCLNYMIDFTFVWCEATGENDWISMSETQLDIWSIFLLGLFSCTKENISSS